MDTNDIILKVKDTFVYQDETPVLKNVNFEMEKGEFLFLIGRTGSGKSSLLKTFYADLPLISGDINVVGHQIRKIPRQEIPYLRRKLGIIFQDFQLFFDRSVAENLYFVMRATGWKDSSKMKERLSDVLMKVGLNAAATKMPHQLSGGEQQRVVVARALVNEPVLLIADEPTGNLDPDVSEGILKLFLEINKSGTAVIMATHNHNLIKGYPARVLKCEEAKLLDSNKDKFSMTDYY